MTFKPTTIGERLKAVRGELGMTGADMGESSGFKPQSYPKTERDERTITPSEIAGVCQAHSVRAGWLLAGEGQMFAEGRESSIDRDRDFARSIGMTSLIKRVEEQAVEISELKAELKSMRQRAYKNIDWSKR